MTKQDLLDNGYNEFPNKKCGTIYVKSPWFCSIDKDGTVDFRYASDDMHSVAKISTVKELHEQEILYYKKRRDSYLKAADELSSVIQLMEETLKADEQD